MSKNVHCLINTVLMSLLFLTQANAATLSSTVNRNKLSTNETLSLTVRYDQQVDSSALNLNELKQAFDVLQVSPQSSSSVSIVNGQATRQAATVWSITLAAKKEGTFTIPAFQVNGDRSTPIRVVVDNSWQPNASDKPLDVRVTTNGNSVYPSQQLIVQIELSAAADVGNLNGSPLLINNADVEELGQQTFQRVDNGVARQVVQIKYAVFAKEPGELTIPIMTFYGVKGARRSVFGNRCQQVVARTKQLPIEVKAIPSKANVDWFPAEEVTLEVKWSGDTSSLSIGTPITRTLVVTAKGQRAPAIPPLARGGSSEDYKSYKDQPQLDNKSSANGYVSTRSESEAIVASKQGPLVLPELRLDWWNTKTERWEQAVLAEQTLNVNAGSNIPTNIAPTPGAQLNSENALVAAGSSSWNSINQILVITSVLLSLLCLWQFWLIRKLGRNKDTQAKRHENQSEKQNWQDLQDAFKKGNAQLVRSRLVSWANSVSGSPITLHDLAGMSESSELAKSINQLEAHLYKGENSVDLSALSKAVNRLKHSLNNTAKAKQNELSPLYAAE